MEEQPPLISAIICTLNRGLAIAKTIDSLVNQDLRADRYEILIVDNGSTPACTEILLAQDRAHSRKIRYVREDRIGESSARNCGLRESHGRYVAFIDDDAVAGRGWLRSLCEAFERDARLGAIGGRVRIKFEAQRPGWLGDDLLPYLSVFELGDSPRTLEFPDYPRGANMAFRRVVFDRSGLFCEDLGLKGSCLLFMSETEMCFRIAAQGWTVAYHPQACVDHLIAAVRLERKWFARRIRAQGRSRMRFELMHHGRWHVLCRVPGQIWGLLEKRGLHRGLHLGYLAAVPGGILQGGKGASQPTQAGP